MLEKAKAIQDAGRIQRNIERVFDVDTAVLPEDPERACVLVRMELLCRMQEHLRGRTHKEVLRMLGDIAAALDCLENRGMLYKGILWSDIMVSDRGEYRLTGFEHVVDEGEEGAFTPFPAGANHTAAPERYCEGRCDHLSNLYSLAMTAYRCLNNFRFPFQAREGNPGITVAGSMQMRMKKDVQIPPLPGVDPEFNGILLKCQRFDPRDRYPSARALLEDTEALLKSKSFTDAPLILP